MTKHNLTQGKLLFSYRKQVKHFKETQIWTYQGKLPNEWVACPSCHWHSDWLPCSAAI